MIPQVARGPMGVMEEIDMDEFDTYCQRKSEEDKARLLPIRQLIQATLADAKEARVHFYLTYDLYAVSIVKLDLGPKSQPRLTFGMGVPLDDPATLLKGKSQILQIRNETHFDKHRAAIADLLQQRARIAQDQWDGVRQIPERDRLRPDQPSP